MAQASFSISLAGLDEATRALQAAGNRTIAATRDAGLASVADAVAARLKDTAPRSAKPGPHLADLFVVSPVRHEGSATAALDITNAKRVGKGRINLVQLLTGGAKAHAIPNAFGWGPTVGLSDAFHPGTAANPFVKNAVNGLDPTPLQRLADRLTVTIVGGETP